MFVVVTLLFHRVQLKILKIVLLENDIRINEIKLIQLYKVLEPKEMK